MKIKLEVEFEVPEGATHYDGELDGKLKALGFYKRTQSEDGEAWLVWSDQDDGWTFMSRHRPHWLKRIPAGGADEGEFLPLPEPDGYVAMVDGRSVIVPPQDYQKHNAYAVFTAHQVRDCVLRDRKREAVKRTNLCAEVQTPDQPTFKTLQEAVEHFRGSRVNGRVVKVTPNINDWFLSLPEGRQAALIEDKWALAQAAYVAGTELAPEPAAPSFDTHQQLMNFVRRHAPATLAREVLAAGEIERAWVKPPVPFKTMAEGSQTSPLNAVGARQGTGRATVVPASNSADPGPDQAAFLVRFPGGSELRRVVGLQNGLAWGSAITFMAGLEPGWELRDEDGRRLSHRKYDLMGRDDLAVFTAQPPVAISTLHHDGAGL
jgi:hypothetical protein